MLQSRGDGFWRGFWNAIKPVAKVDAIDAVKGFLEGLFGGIHGVVAGSIWRRIDWWLGRFGRKSS